MSAHPRSKLKHDHDDMEPQLAQMLDDKLARWTLGEYRACTLEEAEAGLRKLYGNGGSAPFRRQFQGTIRLRIARS